MTSDPPATATELPVQEPLSADLGLSGTFEGEARYLRQDGQFNARRVGLGLAAYNPYTFLLSLGWMNFFLLALGVYLLLNVGFAVLYFLLGHSALSESPNGEARFLADFFFSVQTFGTIGFGHVYPVTLAANVVVTVEAFVGLFAVALLTGMLFARFSRPTHRILFSQQAVIAPYRGGQALMFRLMNGHLTDLSDVNAEVVVTLRPAGAPEQQGVNREFHRLALERERVTLFPLAWTVVHPLDDHSPLHGLTPQQCLERQAEVIVIVRAVDDTSRQSLQARTSYHARDFRWGKKFSLMYVRHAGLLAVDARLLDATEPAPLP